MMNFHAPPKPPLHRECRRKNAECRKEGKVLAEEEGEQGRLNLEPRTLNLEP
jgi:hypothetical protein